MTELVDGMSDKRSVELVGGPMDGRRLVLHEGSGIRLSHGNDQVLGEYDVELRDGQWIGTWRPA